MRLSAHATIDLKRVCWMFVLRQPWYFFLLVSMCHKWENAMAKPFFPKPVTIALKLIVLRSWVLCSVVVDQRTRVCCVAGCFILFFFYYYSLSIEYMCTDDSHGALSAIKKKEKKRKIFPLENDIDITVFPQCGNSYSYMIVVIVCVLVTIISLALCLGRIRTIQIFHSNSKFALFIFMFLQKLIKVIFSYYFSIDCKLTQKFGQLITFEHANRHIKQNPLILSTT